MKTKQELQAIRQDMEKAMAEVAQKHGLQSVKFGMIRHDSDGFKVPLEVQYVGGDSIDMKTLKLNAPFVGLKSEIAGATIEYSGKQCKVVGMKRTKLMLEIQGKNYVANVEDVKRTLQVQKSQYIA